MPNDAPRFDRPARIGQIAITVSDLDRAVAWYADVLGLPLLFRAPPGLAFFECGGVRLMLSRPEPPGVRGRAPRGGSAARSRSLDGVLP